jgi:hypothetical protein
LIPSLKEVGGNVGERTGIRDIFDREIVETFCFCGGKEGFKLDQEYLLKIATKTSTITAAIDFRYNSYYLDISRNLLGTFN